MDDVPEISRLSRLSAILILLQSKRLLTAAQIAKKFQISKRTAYRDIKALEDAGIPIITEEGKGYSLMEGFSLPPIMFSEEEANALIIAEKIIERNKDASLVRHHQNAISKIKAVLKYSNKDKAELLSGRVYLVNNFKEYRSSNHLSTVQIAITNFRPLKIKYKAFYNEETSFRTIEPKGLYHTRENWIMVAWCRMRKDYREFRLDRILTMEVLDTPFENKEFDLIAYFKENLRKNNLGPLP